MFPPRFESTIPNKIKSLHEERRLRKIKKKQIKRSKKLQLASPSLPANPKQKNPQIFPSITSDDVLKFAEQLGMSYPGSREDLRKRVDLILRKQKEDWSSNQ